MDVVNAQASSKVSAAQANARLIATIDDNEDRAALGNYDIEVSSAGKKMTVTITIAGDASQISIDGPDMISTDSGLGAYTITATDVNGNVPADAGELDGKFTVAVRYKDAKVLGLVDDKVDFNSKGVGQFLVQMPQAAVDGDSVSITVVYGSISATKVVTYGEMMAPEPEPMPEAGMAMNLMATANDDGSIMLDWTAGMDANWHFLRGDEVGGDEEVVWTFTSASDSHMVPADMLTSGTEYSFIVIAGYFVKNDAGGWDGGWSAGWTTAAMATAMAGN